MKHFIFTLFSSILICTSVFAQSSESAIKEIDKKYPLLSKVYANKLQNLDVEYIVAIDLSGSMNNQTPDKADTYIGAVKRGLVQFIQAIPDKSKISIVGFGTTVRWIQIPTEITNESRTGISNIINSIRADEGNTDLKGAINFLIEGCSSTSNIKYLFAFTDFNNDPHATSPFNGISWEKLQEKNALISKTSLIEAFALKLPIAQDAGRDLPSVRMVFPGLNVIDFNSVSLQNWFTDRSSKLMEQNLWTFVSKDLKKISDKRLLRLKTKIGIDGKVILSSNPDSIPAYVKGLNLINLDNINTTGERKVTFKANKFFFKDKRIALAKIRNEGSSNPFSSIATFKADLRSEFITTCNQEIEQLYAFVIASSRTGNTSKILQTDVLAYTEPISTGSSFFIAWPLWLFILVAAIVLTFLFLLVKNTLLPYKLNKYAFRLNDGEIIKLKNYYKYVVSSEKGDLKINIPDMLEFEIYGAKADPFNLIVKKSIAIEIIKGSPSVKIQGIMSKKAKKYRLPLLKEVVLTEGLNQIKMQFYKI